MATVTFAGTTIWNDAQTGWGALEPMIVEGSTRWAFDPLPQGDGDIAKELGDEPGLVFLRLFFSFSANGSELASHRSTMRGLKDSYGSLAWPRGSVTNLVLLRAMYREAGAEHDGTNYRQLTVLDLAFRRLRS